MKKATVCRIFNSNGHILLLQRYPTDRTNSGWCLPGGKVDLGEVTNETLRRELKEEIQFEPMTRLHYINDYISEVTGRTTFQVTVFETHFTYLHSDLVLNLKELAAYGWFDLKYLPQDLAGNTLDLIKLKTND